MTTTTTLLDPGLAGHKFARLERLRQAGFPVPGFFCLTADEFDRALDAARAGLEPSPTDPEAWCAAAAAALTASTPSDERAKRLLADFDELIGESGLAAVRACVVPGRDGAGEDAETDPFAGMSDSFLYVPRGDVLSSVARCWASAFNPQAVRYRMAKGIDPTGARVAVGIQRMVPGTRSFVAFTRDPRDAARRHVIAAAHGIGEGVVQEKADIDHFFVDPATGRVEAETVTKHRMIGPPPQPLQPVPPHLAEAPVLTDDQARAVAALAADVEEFFDTPQDIEGTFTPDGALHLVQARPMVLPADASPPQPRVHWGNHNITESYPGISGALTYSQAREFYRSSFTDLYRRMGVPERKLRANAHRLGRMVGFLDGRIYYRLDDWQVLHGQMPVFDLIRAGWEDAMGITGPARAERQWSKTRAAASLPVIAWHAAGHRRAAKRFLRWWDRLMAEVYDAPGAAADRTADEQIALYRRVWDEAGDRWGVTLANGIYGLLVMRAGTTLLRRWTGGGPELLVGLLCGGPENRSLAAARAAIALAERIGAHPELRETLLTADSADEDERIWTDLAANRYGTDIATHAHTYLRRYGDRALHDLKLDEPTPRQRPWMILSVLRPFVRQDATVAKSRAAEATTAAKARWQLRESCRNPLRRAVLHTLLAQMRWLARFREDSRFCRTQLFGISREVLWRLGAELAAAGLLDDPHDVVDLTVDEVIGAFEGTLPGDDPRALAALRKAQRQRNEQAPPLPTLMSVARDRPLAAALRTARPITETDPHAEHEDAPGTLRGLGSSGGSVRGRAKIVLDPSIAPDSCRGRILIARETDPGWLTLMMAADGLVVERGTLLSHTAITGRLLGVPTVVAVAGATARIPDGALIELDGTTGTIRILERSLP